MGAALTSHNGVITGRQEYCKQAWNQISHSDFKKKVNGDKICLKWCLGVLCARTPVTGKSMMMGRNPSTCITVCVARWSWFWVSNSHDCSRSKHVVQQFTMYSQRLNVTTNFDINWSSSSVVISIVQRVGVSRNHRSNEHSQTASTSCFVGTTALDLWKHSFFIAWHVILVLSKISKLTFSAICILLEYKCHLCFFFKQS